MKTKIIFLLFILLALFSSCAVGPDFKKPEAETPEMYLNQDSLVTDTVSVDSMVNLRWWELFDNDILDTLVVRALENNRDVGIAISRLEEARATLGFTKADLYPELNLQASASRGNLAGTFQTDFTTNTFFIAPVVNWEIDFWGKFRRANESARAELIASAYSLRTVQISLISEVVGTYFLLLDFNRRLEISRHTLETRMQSLNIIQQRFDKGVIPEIDLNQAQIQKEIAAASIPNAERSVVKTENALSLLVGQLPGTIEKSGKWQGDLIPPDIPIGLPSTLLERRPDIKQYEYLLRSQNARIGVAEAMRLPAISLTGIFGAASNDLSSLTTGDPAWSISGSLFGPLFNWNKNTLRVEIEEERTVQALLRYENVVLNAFREVEDALTEVRTFKVQLAAVQRKYKAAENARLLSMDRYDKGVTSYLEVLDAERTFFNVELELSELTQLYANAYVKLYKVLGGGWILNNEYNYSPDSEDY